MPKVSTYINFPRTTEAAFNFYKSVFGTEFFWRKVEMPLQEMFWGAYYGSLTDKCGVPWMFNCDRKT